MPVQSHSTDPFSLSVNFAPHHYAAPPVLDHRAEPTDEALLLRIAAADETALSILYARHASSARALARRLLADPVEAEDVVQDVFLTLWGRPSHFDPERGAGRTWLLRVVRNRTLDHLRRRPRAEADDELERVPDEHAANELDALTSALDYRELWAAVERLPAEQRLTIQRAYWQGCTHQQIAEDLSIPLGTVKSRIRLGLEKLRTQLALA